MALVTESNAPVYIFLRAPFLHTEMVRGLQPPAKLTDTAVGQNELTLNTPCYWAGREPAVLWKHLLPARGGQGQQTAEI